MAICKKIFILLILVALSGYGQKVSRRTPVVEVVEKASVSIVNISTEHLIESKDNVFSNEDIFEEFFGRYHPKAYKTRSLGSGIIVDARGFIVTNEHVIRRATKITVTLHNKESFLAELLNSDPENDLAVLKIPASEHLVPMEWGISSDIMIGETAIALGNPFGLESSVSTGVISAANRTIAAGGFNDFIQTDAAINPGNSGGALLNIHGELIGINTAILAQGQGLGFAIPVDRVRSQLGKLLDYQKLKKYSLGLELEETAKEKLAWRVRVKSVAPNSSAKQAGIMAGDYIEEADGEKVQCVFDFNKIIFSQELENFVQVRILQGKSKKTVKVKINAIPKSQIEMIIWRRLGLILQDKDYGVAVTSVRENGTAERIGVKEGDVIVSLGNYKILTVENVGTLLDFFSSGQQVNVVLVRNGEHFGGKITLEK